MGDITTLASFPPVSEQSVLQELKATVTAGVDVQTTLFLIAEQNSGDAYVNIASLVLGYPISLQDPTGPEPTHPSDAWDFVVTSDQDSGGYVADVFVATGGDIRQQLGEQGRCDILMQRLADSPGPRG